MSLSRDNYYTKLPSYHKLSEWQQLIKEHKISTAVDYWKTHKLRNGYVRHRQDSWVPPLYFCSLDPKNGDMVKYLLNKGADPDQLPDSDTADYLPFICHSLYLKTLASRRKGGAYTRCDILDRSINNRLNKADIKRLMHLMILKILDPDVLRSFIRDQDNSGQGIIAEKLNVMVKYLTFLYNVRAPKDPTINLTNETDITEKKFSLLVQFLIEHGATVTDQAIQISVEHYLYNILSVLKPHYATDLPEPVHHVQMDSTTVAVMRPLLNDYRYVQTCTRTGHTPDNDVFNYDINL